MFHGVGAIYETVKSHSGDVFVVKRAFLSDTVSNIFFVKYYALASAVVLYFDYVLTLPDEVRRMWGAKLTGATILFFLNRYVPLIGYIVILVSVFNPPWTIEGWACNMFAPFPGALSTFNQGLISIILVLRTYALYGQNRYVLLATSSAGIVNVVISAWASSAMTGSLFSFQPLVSCVPILQVPQLDRLRYGWIATFAFDFLIFSLTFGRALKLMRTESNKRETVSLARLIVRDGSLYFLVMSIVNALNFVFFLKITNALFSSTTGTNSMIAHVVSVCLINRLLLNLRRESNRYNDGSSGVTSTTLTDTRLMFTTRIMGNLTAELMTSNDVAQDAYNYTSGDSRRSTNRFTSSFSAYSGRSLLSATSNLSRSTGYYPSSGSAISTVGTASGNGQYSLAGTNAVASSSGQISGQRGGLPPFSPISETDSPSTAVTESHPFWSSSSKCKSPVSPLSNETAVMVEDRWKEAENGEVAIEMVRLDIGDAPPPPEEEIH